MNDLQSQYARAAKLVFEQIDHLRRRQGALLASSGFGPVETPYQVVHATVGVRLRRYGDAACNAPAILIIPAPIKQAYIWDLAPEISVVRRCIEHGMHVYLVEWTPVSDAARHVGLEDYGGRLLRSCVDIILAQSKNTKLILAGHSLGGVLATIFACLHPRQVQALVLLETPLHFGADAGNLAKLSKSMQGSRPLDAEFGNVPGSFLNLASSAAAPQVFQWERYIDRWLAMARPATLKTHLRVERWLHDEFPLPGKLFSDIVELLYRNDQLMNGHLCVAGREIGPRNVKVPLLNVIDRRSTIVPPQAVLPFHQAAASTSKKIVWYEGDVGVGLQHVGVLVGDKAHALVWPAIFEWLTECDIS